MADRALPAEADFVAVKLANFLASFIAGGLGMLILWPRRKSEEPKHERQGQLPRC